MYLNLNVNFSLVNGDAISGVYIARGDVAVLYIWSCQKRKEHEHEHTFGEQYKIWSLVGLKEGIARESKDFGDGGQVI